MDGHFVGWNQVDQHPFQVIPQAGAFTQDASLELRLGPTTRPMDESVMFCRIA
jgi:hypothetical protein